MFRIEPDRKSYQKCNHQHYTWSSQIWHFIWIVILVLLLLISILLLLSILLLCILLSSSSILILLLSLICLLIWIVDIINIKIWIFILFIPFSPKFFQFIHFWCWEQIVQVVLPLCITCPIVPLIRVIFCFHLLSRKYFHLK